MGSNPTGGMDVCCECCVLLGRGLCDELITRAEESYRLWCVVECDIETSRMRGHGGCCAKKKNSFEDKLKYIIYKDSHFSSQRAPYASLMKASQ